VQKTHFLRKNDVQSVANGDRRRIEIGLRPQCDIRRSYSSNRRNLTSFSYHSSNVCHRQGSCSSYLSKTMAKRTQNMLVYSISVSQGSVATRFGVC